MLSIQLEFRENSLIYTVLQQNEKLKDNFDYHSYNNSFDILSTDHPKLCNDVMHVRGTYEALDSVPFVKIFISNEIRDQYVERCIGTLNEWSTEIISKIKGYVDISEGTMQHFMSKNVLVKVRDQDNVAYKEAYLAFNLNGVYMVWDDGKTAEQCNYDPSYLKTYKEMVACKLKKAVTIREQDKIIWTF